MYNKKFFFYLNKLLCLWTKRWKINFLLVTFMRPFIKNVGTLKRNHTHLYSSWECCQESVGVNSVTIWIFSSTASSRERFGISCLQSSIDLRTAAHCPRMPSRRKLNVLLTKFNQRENWSWKVWAKDNVCAAAKPRRRDLPIMVALWINKQFSIFNYKFIFSIILFRA